MKSFNIKVTIITILSVGIILIFLIPYLISSYENYKETLLYKPHIISDRELKIAEKKRNKRIKDLDSQDRFFIDNGLYSFEHYYLESQLHQDLSGNYYNTTVQKYLGRGEVSLANNKILIYCNGIRDELIVKPTIIDIQTFSSYTFEIEEWKAFNITNNDCIFDLNQDEKLFEYFVDDKPILLLNIKSYYSRLEKNFPEIQLNIKPLLTISDRHFGFQCIQSSHIYLETLIHRYLSPVNPPSYVDNAKYPDYIYDINSYVKE